MPRSIEAQIDAFLSNQAIGSSDVVLMNIPLSYVLRPVNAIKAGTLTQAAALTQIGDSGVALAAQVKRLIAAGAKYIVVAGAYDVGRSPYGIAMNVPSMLTSEVQKSSAAVTHLNDTFKIEVAKLGANVLFVDAAFLVNRNVQFGPNWGFVNSTTAICTTPTALTCTDSTLVASANKTQYLFADNIHLTPNGNQQLGDFPMTSCAAAGKQCRCPKKNRRDVGFFFGWVPGCAAPLQHLSGHFQPLAVNVVVTRSAIS